jgi:hypothetical protein
MLDAQFAVSGDRLRIYFLIGDARCTAWEGLDEWCGSQKNPEDAAADFLERLRFIARRGESARSDWFERMRGRSGVWAVRKKRLRLYGFVVDDCLYLCTHDPCKSQDRADQRILDRTEDLRDEWEAQWLG